jgi:hypothetical protein
MRRSAVLSSDDRFIGDTAMAAGIPKAIQELTLQFRHKNIDSSLSEDPR